MTAVNVPESAYLILLGGYLVFSAAAFVMYGMDKSSAVHGGWRIPELWFHMVALAGGWPGALIAQRVFHHKTRKQPFRTVFWFTVWLNILALARVLSSQESLLALLAPFYAGR